MKKYIVFALIAVLVLSLFAGCSPAVEPSTPDTHKIGIATYNIRDAQIMMFKEYLDKYIKACFEDVEFLYSDSISGGEDMMEFLTLCADNGAEGIMVFGTVDLIKEVEFCAGHEMYLIRPSGTSTDAVFDAVASNPYFVGEIGPGAENEYGEAEKMTRALAGEGKRYVILSGGASRGNEMHRLRTLAMLDVLQEVHGVQFEQGAEELAVVSEQTTVAVGGLELMICPGYLEGEAARKAASEVISTGAYTTVLSAVPVTALADVLDAAEVQCGVIDCFSEDNYLGFKSGRIAYVAGKYQSEIGPGFAALYNAVTGNAGVYRVDGRAFRLEQGFWRAANNTEYDSMYALACGAAVNAYNCEDLYSVIKILTPEADFEDLKTLTENYSYEECLARRSS